MEAIFFIMSFFIAITIHECGHFFAAKLLGFNVEEFALGIGPKIKINLSKTTILLGCIPLGGHCIISEFAHGNTNKASPRKQNIKKIFFLFAGPLANLIFAAILFAFFSHGRSIFDIFQKSFSDLIAVYIGWIEHNLIMEPDGALPAGIANPYNISVGDRLHSSMINLGFFSLLLFYVNMLPFIFTDGYKIVDSIYTVIFNRMPGKLATYALMVAGVAISLYFVNIQMFNF